MQISKELKEQIEKESVLRYPTLANRRDPEYGFVLDMQQAFEEGAEYAALKSQPLVEALELIKSWSPTGSAFEKTCSKALKTFIKP